VLIAVLVLRSLFAAAAALLQHTPCGALRSTWRASPHELSGSRRPRGGSGAQRRCDADKAAAHSQQQRWQLQQPAVRPAAVAGILFVAARRRRGWRPQQQQRQCSAKHCVPFLRALHWRCAVSRRRRRRAPTPTRVDPGVFLCSLFFSVGRAAPQMKLPAHMIMVHRVHAHCSSVRVLLLQLLQVDSYRNLTVSLSCATAAHALERVSGTSTWLARIWLCMCTAMKVPDLHHAAGTNCQTRECEKEASERALHNVICPDHCALCPDERVVPCRHRSWARSTRSGLRPTWGVLHKRVCRHRAHTDTWYKLTDVYCCPVQAVPPSVVSGGGESTPTFQTENQTTSNLNQRGQRQQQPCSWRRMP
jgi:hypothetical protein